MNKNLSQNQLLFLNTNYNSDTLIINQTISSSYHTDYKNSQLSQLKDLHPKSLQQVNSFINIQENSTGLETQSRDKASSSPTQSKIVSKKQSELLSNFQQFEDLARSSRSIQGQKLAGPRSNFDILKSDVNRQSSLEDKRNRGNSQVRFADEKAMSKDSNQMQFILTNIKESIDIMSSRLNQGSLERERNQDSVEREIQKLQNLQASANKKPCSRIEIQMTKKALIERKGSMNKFAEVKNLRDSWQSALSDNNLGQRLKSDEAYCQILQSNSQKQLNQNLPQSFDILSQQRRGNSYSPLRDQKNTSSLSFDNLQEISNTLNLRSLRSPERVNSSITIPSTVSPLHQKFQNLNNQSQLVGHAQGSIQIDFNSKDTQDIQVSEDKSKASQDQFSDLTFNDITQYLDQDSQIKLRNKIHKIQRRESHIKDKSLAQTKSNQTASQVKRDEIIMKLVSSNSAAQNSLISIPEDILNDIEEYGLDSMAILKTVLTQFSHLFQSTPTFPLQRKMKSQLNQSSQSRASLNRTSQSKKIERSSSKTREKQKKSKADLRAEIEQQWLKNYEEANVFTLNKKAQMVKN